MRHFSERIPVTKGLYRGDIAVACMEQVDRNVLWAEVERSSVYSAVVVWKRQSKGFKTALAARKLGGEERQCEKHY